MDWIRGDYYMQNKYIEKLINYKSLDEFVTMFFGLSLCEKLSVLGDDMIVPKEYCDFVHQVDKSKVVVASVK